MFDLIHQFEQVLLSGPLAFLFMMALTPLVIRLAHHQDWLAYPKADRWHAEPTALMGGIAIVGSVLLAALMVTDVGALWPIWLGASLLFVTGLVDDLREIQPATKFAAQLVATLCLLFAGYTFGNGWPIWIAMPLTFLWVTGITNAVNLLDNMDGLASGIAGIAATTLVLFTAISGHVEEASALAAVAGAAFGFLVYNFKPARVFMGDCGSLFLGYLIAAFAVVIQGQSASGEGFAIYLVSAAVLAVPILDTTLVTFVRTLAGRSVSQGGRDHTSHRLVFLGLSERRAVLTLYSVSALFGVLALIFHFAEVKLFYAVAAFMVVGLLVFGSHLGSIDVYAEEEKDLQRRSSLKKVLVAPRALFGHHWKVVFGMAGDVLLVGASFVLAHFLRFENGLGPEREAFVVMALPAVVGLKVMVFYASGLYRGVWRHAGTPELIRIGQASVVASALVYGGLGLFYGIDFLSEATFFIDWMVTTLAATGCRLGFRGMRQYLSAHRKSGRRVLLYGAGDAGLLSLREIRQNPELELVALGFVDDDPCKQNRVIQGLPVMGGLDDLAQLCDRHRVEEVLITAFKMSDDRKLEITERCDEIGVDCRLFRLSFTSPRRSYASGDGAAVAHEAIAASAG